MQLCSMELIEKWKKSVSSGKYLFHWWWICKKLLTASIMNYHSFGYKRSFDTNYLSSVHEYLKVKISDVIFGENYFHKFEFSRLWYMQFVLWFYFLVNCDIVSYADGTTSYSTDKSPESNVTSLERVSIHF